VNTITTSAAPPGVRKPRRARSGAAADREPAAADDVPIGFALIIIPFVFLELRPEATKAALKHAQDWLLAHARQLKPRPDPGRLPGRQRPACYG
jgi:hypothetical protein